jgi:hypothetical protein
LNLNIDNKNIVLWSGKQVFSFTLPENVNLEMENGLCEDLKGTSNQAPPAEVIAAIRSTAASITSSSLPRTPENNALLELSLCLSRACIGKGALAI